MSSGSASLLRACVSALLIGAALGAVPRTRKLAQTTTLPRNIPWQWQLSDNGVITKIPGVQWYDIDMDTAGDGQLAALKKQDPSIKVICYISVGSWEKFRVQNDKTRRGIQPTDWNPILGKAYSPPFQNEKWLDIRSDITRQIMSKRFNYAQSIGCDGIEPDNTGANDEDTGFALTAADAFAYSIWIAQEVHNRGMLVGLKNTINLLPQLNQYYDYFLNEQCGAYDECGVYSVVGTQKPVFGAEYCDATAAGNGVTQDPGCYCPEAIASGRSVLIKNTDLDAKVLTCAAYCAANPCPGRAGRKNCKAGKANICKAVFATPTVAPVMG